MVLDDRLIINQARANPNADLKCAEDRRSADMHQDILVRVCVSHTARMTVTTFA